MPQTVCTKFKIRVPGTAFNLEDVAQLLSIFAIQGWIRISFDVVNEHSLEFYFLKKIGFHFRKILTEGFAL